MSRDFINFDFAELFFVSKIRFFIPRCNWHREVRMLNLLKIAMKHFLTQRWALKAIKASTLYMFNAVILTLFKFKMLPNINYFLTKYKYFYLARNICPHLIQSEIWLSVISKLALLRIKNRWWVIRKLSLKINTKKLVYLQ